MVSFSEPTAFEVPVVTYRSYERDDRAMRFTLRKNDRKRSRAMAMEVCTSGPVVFRDEKIENPGRPDITRLGFAFEQPVTNATFTVVYSTR